jgi:hypothetical protein
VQRVLRVKKSGIGKESLLVPPDKFIKDAELCRQTGNTAGDPEIQTSPAQLNEIISKYMSRMLILGKIVL